MQPLPCLMDQATLCLVKAEDTLDRIDQISSPLGGLPGSADEEKRGLPNYPSIYKRFRIVNPYGVKLSRRGLFEASEGLYKRRRRDSSEVSSQS